MGLERQYKVWNFRLKERSAGRSSEGGDPLVYRAKGETRWSLKQTCQLPRVCSPTVALLHKKGPRFRRKICANSLWLYSCFTKTSPSKNKNINYIFIYLRVFRCLSSCAICNIKTRVKTCSHNVQSHPLVEPNNILLSPWHIKFELIKNFVKAIDREGSNFAFLLGKFSRISMKKL